MSETTDTSTDLRATPLEQSMEEASLSSASPSLIVPIPTVIPTTTPVPTRTPVPTGTYTVPTQPTTTPVPTKTPVPTTSITVPPPITTTPPRTTLAPPRTTLPPPVTTLPPPKTTLPPPVTTLPPPKTTLPPRYGAQPGVIVGKTSDKLGTQATQQVQDSIAKESTAVKPVLNAFQDTLDQILKTGSMKEKSVVVSMRNYIQKMTPGLPVEIKDGIFLQQGLWKLIQTVTNSDEDFDKSFKLLISFFKEYKDTTLSERYVFRFVENMTMGMENIRAFQSAINIIMIAATTINKKDVKKQVDLNRALSSGHTEEARRLIISYFD